MYYLPIDNLLKEPALLLHTSYMTPWLGNTRYLQKNQANKSSSEKFRRTRPTRIFLKNSTVRKGKIHVGSWQNRSILYFPPFLRPFFHNLYISLLSSNLSAITHHVLSMGKLAMKPFSQRRNSPVDASTFTRESLNPPFSKHEQKT